MTTFDYEALDTAGRRRRGVVAAESLRLAQRELRRRHLLALRIDPAARPAGGRLAGARAPAMSARERTLTLRQLATLLGAGIAVEDALGTIASQTALPASRHILLGVRGEVLEGRRLSDAMAHQKRAFTPLLCALVAAGETAGRLPVVLARIADDLEKGQKIRRKLVTALTYPCALAITAAAVVLALMIFVVPRVVAQFDQMDRELPALTVAMIGISDFLATWWLWLAALLAALVAGTVMALRYPHIARRRDAALLATPLLGRLLRDLAAARLARTLATLIGAGIPLAEALSATVGTIANRVLRDGLARSAAAVREGSGLADALGQSALLTPMVVQMAAVGESSGQLPMMLDKAADHLESEFSAATEAALSLLEPAIIIVMGGLVLLIVLSILLPILRLNTMPLT